MAIEHITITVGCDRNLHCGTEKIHQDGPDVDSELLAEALRGRDWIVTDDEYICPACVPAYEAEQDELERQAESDEWTNDPRRGQAAWINRHCF